MKTGDKVTSTKGECGTVVQVIPGNSAVWNPSGNEIWVENSVTGEIDLFWESDIKITF